LLLAWPAAAGDGALPGGLRAEYRAQAELEAELAALAEAGGLSAEWVSLGNSPEGRAVRCFAFGDAGGPPLAQRPTLWLIGPLDGCSLAGGEAVLEAARHLAPLAGERPDLAIACLPWPVPDLLERIRTGGAAAGRPGDEDGDGRVDEDGPDDLDGDGRILEMVIETPGGPWTWDRERRFLVPAEAGAEPRLERALEGADDDGDGRFNEDGAGPGGLEGTFPVGWSGPGLPLGDEVGRRLADEIVARRGAAVLVFQGHHGALARAAGEGLDEADDRALARWAMHLATAGAWARETSAAECAASTSGGSFQRWCRAVPAVPVLEVAPWGPCVGTSLPAPTGAVREAGPGVVGERAWARWLDDRRGGLGFAAWRPVALGTTHAWVGGWEPLTRTTPPPDELPVALADVGELARRCLRSLPRLEIELLSAQREGELVRLAACVRNAGELPTELATAGRWSRRPRAARALELELPAGARLFAGPPRTELPALEAGAASEPCEWIVVAPAGSRLALAVVGPGGERFEREVRP